MANAHLKQSHLFLERLAIKRPEGNLVLTAADNLLGEFRVKLCLEYHVL